MIDLISPKTTRITNKNTVRLKNNQHDALFF